VVDVENIVFSTVATALRDTFKPPTTDKVIFVSGEATAAPSSFPAATLVEIDNATYERTLDSDHTESHAQLGYQLDVYSNLVSGRKSQCKAILKVADEEMFSMGFIRVNANPVEMAQGSIYRMTARYRAVVAAGEASGENVIYRTYRR
jgi:hypothetical protein